MYSKDEVKTYQQQTKDFLAYKPEEELKDAETLRNVLRFHEYQYYVLSESLMGDIDYDQLYTLLKEWEAKHPEDIPADSPTQRVGSSLNKDFPKRQHLVPMLSLDNSYNAEDLLEWDKRVRETTGLKEITYCAEPKFDGASISLQYESDHLVAATTRGDGEVGDDITLNAKQIRSIPLSAGFSKYGVAQIEIRGEVMMNKQNFLKYNEALTAEGGAVLANPRNAAAGSLRMKDSKQVAKRNLEAFLYNVSFERDAAGETENKPTTHSGMLEMLWQLGFKSPVKEMKVLNGIEAVIKFIAEYETKRDNLAFEIDGMVIKVDDLALQDQLGMTSHHPRWAMAFKYKARQANSILNDVEYQVGRTGAVTPVAKIQPVQVGGVTVGSISIHNEDYIREKDLKLGDKIIIERSGDVIPQIVRSVTEERTGAEKDIVFPKVCPVCKDELYKPEGEAVWRCININCKAQVVERIIHYVSKDAMDIKGFGEANVRRFYEQELITDIPSIYTLSSDSLQGLEGFGQKSIDNLLAGIETSKTQPLHRLIYSLGIRYVGETTAKTLAQVIKNILDLRDMNIEALQNVEDVGVKVAASIHEFFDNADNISMLKKLEDAGVMMERQQAAVSAEGKFSGKTFLFTGTLSQLKRSEAEADVEAEGGKILSGVSSKLDYLVVGADAGSKLEKAKKMTGIKILSEEEFLKMI